MNSKTLSVAAAAAIVATILAAGPVLAVESGSTAGSAPKVGANFCSRLSTFVTNLTNRWTERETALNQRRAEREANLADRQAERDKRLTDNRAAQDAKRAAQYEKLVGKAKTDEQKQAIEKFKTAIEASQTTRRAVVDAAVVAFRDGLKTAIASRKTGADAARETYRAAIEQAQQAAVSACSAQNDMATIKANLKAALEAARAKYQSEKEATVKLGETVKQLVETRQAAFAKALADFKAAVEKAKADLKANWPKEKTADTATE